MSILQIDLHDVINKRRLWVTLRDNLPIQDLVQILVMDLELPQGEYELSEEESGQKLPLDSTLKKEGIQDGSQLRLKMEKKAPTVIPVPIISGGKVSAESPPEGQSQNLKGKKSDKSRSAPPKSETPAKEKSPEETGKPRKRKYPQDQYRPPTGPAHRPGKPDPTVNFWHRPFHQPPFLRWIPVSLWFYVRPILILILILVMILCFIFGQCVCCCQGTTATTAPSPGSNSSNGQEDAGSMQKAAEEQPTNFENLPEEIIFTYENNNLYEAYTSGNYSYDTEEVLDAPKFPDITETLTRDEIAVVRVAPVDDPNNEHELILIAINEAIDPVSGYSLFRVKDIESGVEYVGRVKEGTDTVEIYDDSRQENKWTQINLRELKLYEPTEGCWYFTAFLALNINTPPLDNLDLRRALLYSFDAQTILEASGIDTANIASTFIPTGTLQMENLDPNAINGRFYDPEIAQSYFQSAQNASALFNPDFLEIFYYESCEGMGSEAMLMIQNWSGDLGINGSAISEAYDFHFNTPIEGSGRMLSYTTYGHSNIYSFYRHAIESGSIMLPAEAETQLIDLLANYAYESDLQMKTMYVDEMEKLVLEEYAVAIPLYYFQSCY